jgi:hypothetical protein
MAKTERTMGNRRQHKQGPHCGHQSILDAKVKQTLNSLFIGTAHQTFLDYFNELWTKWGRNTPNDIRDNGNRMRAPWDPVHQDMAELINQIRNASIFGHFTNHNISDLDMVTAGEQLIIDTGLFASQYVEWRRRPENTRAWTDFEVFWTTEYDLWIETSRTANSVGMGYAGQAESTSNILEQPTSTIQRQSITSLMPPTISPMVSPRQSSKCNRNYEILPWQLIARRLHLDTITISIKHLPPLTTHLHQLSHNNQRTNNPSNRGTIKIKPNRDNIKTKDVVAEDVEDTNKPCNTSLDKYRHNNFMRKEEHRLEANFMATAPLQIL